MDAKVKKLITCHRIHHPRTNIERQERKWWKRIDPTRIDLQNNHDRIKEILRQIECYC